MSAAPQLRGLLHGEIKRNIFIALGLCTVSGVAWKFLVMDRRKQAYADFYANYDAEADYQRMQKLNLFQSFPAK